MQDFHNKIVSMPNSTVDNVWPDLTIAHVMLGFSSDEETHCAAGHPGHLGWVAPPGGLFSSQAPVEAGNDRHGHQRGQQQSDWKGAL